MKKWWGMMLVTIVVGVAVIARVQTQQNVAGSSPTLQIDQGTFDKGDTAWMLTSLALVLMMVGPGLALFYGGLVRKKNVVAVMMQCFFLVGLMSLIWALYGFSLAFADGNTFIGGLDYTFLRGVAPYYDGENAVYPLEGTVTREVFMIFQGMFFIITPALICGAFAERMKFSAMVWFILLWGTFVYCPLAHWVWGGGWLGENGPFPGLDFAGGTVVHISSGVSGLICSLVLGKRLGYGKDPMPPHNLTYTYIGTCLLWVGWFGFNAGSALAADQSAVNAFVVTHLASSAMAAITWSLCEWLRKGTPTLLGICSGAVAGLVCITPGSGYVTPMASLVFGAVAGLVCFYAVTQMKSKLGYDDSLDAFGMHGVGGTVGALLTGIFASRAVSPKYGLLEGNARQLLDNAVGALSAWLLAAIGTLIILKIGE